MTDRDGAARHRPDGGAHDDVAKEVLAEYAAGATHAPTADAGTPAFQPKWRHTTAAVVNALDVCPDGNGYEVLSGCRDAGPTENFTPCVTTALDVCA